MAAAEVAQSAPTATSGSAAIAAQLRRAILGGAYDYRERLPSERELADHFAASRSTVREALRQLEDMHLVSRRIGSGTFVTHNAEFGGPNIAEITSPLELIEVRFAFEPHIARLAAINATARELEQLAAALARLESCGADREIFSREDEAFHLALAECARNPLMVWLYRRINSVRGHKQWNAMKDMILTPDRSSPPIWKRRAAICSARPRPRKPACRGNPIWKSSVPPRASITQHWAIAAPRAVSEREPSARRRAPGA
jgi:DNA-binding FadR family transcriptional regulator